MSLNFTALPGPHEIQREPLATANTVEILQLPSWCRHLEIRPGATVFLVAHATAGALGAEYQTIQGGQVVTYEAAQVSTLALGLAPLVNGTQVEFVMSSATTGTPTGT